MEHPDFQTLGDRKPLNRSASNLTEVITSGTSLHMQTLVFLSLRGAVVHMREVVAIRVYFFTSPLLFSCAPVEIAPFDRFSCFMAQKTCFGDSYVLFGVRTKILIISTIFRKKREIPYSRNVKLQSAITPVL